MLVFTSGFSTRSEQSGSPVKLRNCPQSVLSMSVFTQCLPNESVMNISEVQTSSPVQLVQKGQSNGNINRLDRKTRVIPFGVKKHRRGKRNSLKLVSNNFSWVGNNIAGAKSKWASLQRWVRMKSPLILSLQETKFQVLGKHNLPGYIAYEHLRSEKTAGGGIFLAIEKGLSPALVRDGGQNIEAITVDISVKKMQITCVTAYGPQEKEASEKKDMFWQYLEEDAIRANYEGKGFILQGDLNAWLGNKYIAKDLRKQNDNGRHMEDFIVRNHLTVVNGLSVCKGLFTRKRKTKDTWEKGILDFFVVC